MILLNRIRSISYNNKKEKKKKRFWKRSYLICVKKNDFICKKLDLLLDTNKKKKTFERGSTFIRQIYYACITY